MAEPATTNNELQYASSKDGRWRIVVLLVGVLTICVVVLALWYQQWRQTATHRDSVVANTAKDVKGSAGGNHASKRYRELVNERNRIAAEKAKREGGSAVMTILSGEPTPADKARQKASRDPASAELVLPIPPAEPHASVSTETPAARTQPPQAVAHTPPPPQVNGDVVKFATALVNGWNPGVHGDFYPKLAAASKGGSSSIAETNAAAGVPPAQAPQGRIIARAGSTAFASLDMTLNSDVGGPVRATILTGPMKGSRLLGGFKQQENSKLLVVTFNVMVMPDGSSVPVTAYLIDPENAMAAMRSSVDNHYLLKVAAPLAAAFLAGYGTPTPTVVATNASTIVGTSDDTSNKQRGLAAVGNVALDILRKAADRPPTVVLDAGVGIGVLFMTDVRDQPVSIDNTQTGLAFQVGR